MSNMQQAHVDVVIPLIELPFFHPKSHSHSVHGCAMLCGHVLLYKVLTMETE
jgi:hypothetical protein